MRLKGLLVTILWNVIAAVRAEQPPDIVLPPQNQYVLEDTKATFVCEATGDPFPEIVWLKNRKPITTGRRKFRITNMPNRSILRVIPSGKRDMNISCKAENGVGRPVVKSAMLKNLEAVPSGFPTITVNPTMRALFEGRDTVMICSADGYPTPAITWLKNDVPVDMGDARFSMLPTGSLHIGRVKESDAGVYECVAENSIGTTYSEPANLFVRVQDLPPTFYTEPQSQEVPLGGSVNLTCASAGRPAPEILWRKNSEEASSSHVLGDGTNVLTLTDLRESANYTCFAFSKVGFAVSTAEITVVNVTDGNLDAPPSHFTLILVSRQPPKVRLDWQPSPLASDLLSGHIVKYYKRGQAGQVREAFVPLGTNTFLSDVLDYESVYEFTLSTVQADSTKEPSTPVTATVTTPTEVTTLMPPLDGPRNLTVDDYDCNTGVAILNWQLPELERDVDILHYELWTYTEDGLSKMLKVQEPDYAVTGLSGDNKYIFAIRAVDLRGPGKFSANLTIEKCETKLFAPKDISIRRLSKTSIEVSWVDPDDKDSGKVEGYKIMYRVHAGDSAWKSEDVGPSASAVLNDLQQDHVYEIRLQAKNHQGYGQVSEAILSPKTSSQVGLGVMFGRPSMLETRARIICTISIALPQVVSPGTAKAFSINVVPVDAAGLTHQEPYTAAIFTDELPSQFALGDGRSYGAGSYNIPLEDGREYKVYVKAYTEAEGYFLVSDESEVMSTGRCRRNLLTSSSKMSAAHSPLLVILVIITLVIHKLRDTGT